MGEVQKNYNKRLIKSPKLYFWDSGLLCYLLQITRPKDLETHAYRGHIFENYIISEIRKNILNHKLNQNIYFWKDKQSEIDCIIEKEMDQFEAIEIKSGRTYTSNYKKALEYLRKISTDKISYKILYAGNESRKLSVDMDLISENSCLFSKVLPKREFKIEVV